MVKMKRKDDAISEIKRVDSESLKLDVKDFASKLGFSSGKGNDSAFDDFAPSKAKERIGSRKLKKHGGDQTPKDKTEKALIGKKAGIPLKVKSQQSNELKVQHDGPVDGGKSRDWNFGVGPRPGEEGGFKSLLGSSDPAIWYEALSSLPPLLGTAPEGEPDLDLVETLRQEGEKLLEAEAAVFERELQRRNSADYKWLQQVKRSGTTADKVAAMTLMIRESPVANLKSLDTLLSWVQKRKGGREVVRQAIEALQELMLTVLLPDRKLRFLEQQPVQILPKGKEGGKRLLYWYLEDALKRRYNMMVTALEECTRDNLDFIKERATKCMYELLSKKPEAEARLLSGITNKLGDPSRKIASNAGYLLGQLLLTHPAMKPVVLREVERFLFRPGLQERARYYAVVFLNQMVLSHKLSEGGGTLAKKLIELYFTMFRMVIQGHFGRAGEARKIQEERHKAELKRFRKQQSNQKSSKASGPADSKSLKKSPKAPKKAEAEEMDARMLGALITGVRRAFPYVDAEEVEALIENSSDQLFKIVHKAPFTVGVQALMLMFQLMSSRNSIPDRFYRALYAVLLTEGPSTSSKGPMFLGLVFKALKADASLKRVAAMVKRLFQAAHNAPSNFACAVIFLVSELLKTHRALWSGILQPEDVEGGGVESFKDEGAVESEEEERFRDVEASSEDEEESLHSNKERRARSDVAASPPSTSGRETPSAAAAQRWPQKGYYDMTKREPLYCDADRGCWWELTTLASHAHPSVAAMARTLLGGQPVMYDGDPMRDHTLAAFLDKFLLKKPKAHARGSSLMQPLAGGGGGALNKQQKTLGELSGAAFAALAETQVQPAELFFHKFYNLKTVKSKLEKSLDKKRKREDDSDKDDEDVDVAGVDSDDEEIDRMIDKAEEGGDDALGDPDVGFSYDELAASMAEDDLSGDEDGGEGQSSADEDEDEFMDDAFISDDKVKEDDESLDEGEARLDAVDALSSESLDLEDSDGDFELAPGAAEYLAAARARAATAAESLEKESSKSSRKSSVVSRKSTPLPNFPTPVPSHAAEEPDDDDLDGLELLTLPEPGSDEEEGLLADNEDADSPASAARFEDNISSVSARKGVHSTKQRARSKERRADLTLISQTVGEDVLALKNGSLQKSMKKASANKPRRSEDNNVFASAEKYEHLLQDVNPDGNMTARKRIRSSNKKESS